MAKNIEIAASMGRSQRQWEKRYRPGPKRVKTTICLPKPPRIAKNKENHNQGNFNSFHYRFNFVLKPILLELRHLVGKQVKLCIKNVLANWMVFYPVFPDYNRKRGQ
jgi:hypothetical protein